MCRNKCLPILKGHIGMKKGNFHTENFDGDRWNNTIGPSLKMEATMVGFST